MKTISSVSESPGAGRVDQRQTTSKMPGDADKVVAVTAALLLRGNRLFIARRPPDKRFGLYWEFPGGKVEPGESLEASLQREIDEELGLRIEVGAPFHVVRCRKPKLMIDLHAYWCTIIGGTLVLNEHVDYAWVSLRDLRAYSFTEADCGLIPLLEKLNLQPADNSSGP